MGLDEGRHGEHGTGAFCVARGDNRRVDILESTLLEKRVSREGSSVPNSINGTKGVPSNAKVCNFAKVFKGCTFFLQGIRRGVGGTEKLNAGRLHFNRLTNRW